MFNISSCPGLTKITTFTLLLLSLFGLATSTHAAVEFDFNQSTPVGSWAVHEDLTTDEKGRQTVNVIKMSVVGKESIENSPYIWIELDSQSYKIKKEQRKKQGDRVILKALVDISTFEDSPANVLGNLSKYAKTVIIQNGNNDPMMIENGGMLAQSMMQAAGVSVEFNYKEQGTKTMDVPAGKFSCKLVSGSGTTEVKVLIKTMKISSEIESCYSNDIPFGLIQSSSTTVTNGSESTTVGYLVEFGKTGAATAITKKAQKMPEIPKFL